MRAKLIFKDRLSYPDGDFAALVLWDVPTPVPPTTHGFKYRLVYISNGVRVIGFDNERGKGDHRHDQGIETPYIFHSPEQLIADFTFAVQTWRRNNGRP